MQQIGAETKRNERRVPFKLTAKVSFATSIVSCVVMNLSRTGTLISCESYVMFPETVSIELQSGVVWKANLRWQRGLRAGFVFIDP